MTSDLGDIQQLASPPRQVGGQVNHGTEGSKAESWMKAAKKEETVRNTSSGVKGLQRMTVRSQLDLGSRIQGRSHPRY